MAVDATSDVRRTAVSASSVSCVNGCSSGRCAVAAKTSSDSVELSGGWREVVRLQGPPSRSLCFDFGARREPFIVGGDCASRWGWPAADGRWRRPQYFRDHPSTRLRCHDADAALVGFKAWRRSSERCVSGQAALAELCSRTQKNNPGATTNEEALYLTSWEYHPPDQHASTGQRLVGSESLIDDICGGVPIMPCLFDASWHPGLKALSRLLRWIYIGERGSACETHADPIASHAWMWLASGEKLWRFAVSPHTHVDTEYGVVDTDLFDCAAIAKANVPIGTRLFYATMRPGDLIFVPSLVFHSVRNCGTELTIAVSHNFLDATCLGASIDVLTGALRAFLCLRRGDGGKGVAGLSREAAFEVLADRMDSPLFAFLSVALSSDGSSVLSDLVSAAKEESSLFSQSAGGSSCGVGVKRRRLHDSGAAEGDLLTRNLEAALSLLRACDESRSEQHQEQDQLKQPQK
eukprot:TRINITY_DN6966_c0_g2_i1.p1 TRINITY_DN6966_c0_g2~~TRINITY_DN6966_c0_g2_i1.p1  ORF type:complete len:485 (-),score=62.94 TRINITY_DN6966_c0_g2_i1:7-1398(-)